MSGWFWSEICYLPSALLVILLPIAGSAAETNAWTTASPGGQCAITVVLDGQGQLGYQVSRLGKVIIPNSPLGLRQDDEDFERGLVFERDGGVETRREQYELFAGGAPRVDSLVQHRRLEFRNAHHIPMELEIAVSDQGVAFRYLFEQNQRSMGKNPARVVLSEATGFNIPLDARGWLQPYHAASEYTPAYEDFYFHVSAGDPPPDSRAKAKGWAFPALFYESEAKVCLLLTESGTDASYCACHLAPDCAGGVYRIAFPLPDEATKNVTPEFGPEPRSTLPWTMPWRVIVLGKSAGDIAMETLVTDLAGPSRIADTSWIKPGRVSWSWWSYPKGPHTAERFNEFTDFAVRMGWEYTLFDAGWWEPGLPELAGYAKSKGIVPLAWNHASDFYDAEKRKSKLDEIEAAGVRGVKVDFWCSDRQETMVAMHALFREAAARHLLVNLHGCTVPRGWERTWPNLLTMEAVLGTECYIFDPPSTEKAAELNTVLPFTRNAIGPMDTTPVACSTKTYARTTTAAHELATAIILKSGLIHYADKPEFFESLPAEALRVFRDAPARWDETRCLAGDPGRLAVFARRSGGSWFIAGLNGTNTRLPLNLDLSAFNDFPKRLLVAEGQNVRMEVSVATVERSAHWRHEMPPRGGFILRLDR